jgi:hypothetical protein
MRVLLAVLLFPLAVRAQVTVPTDAASAASLDNAATGGPVRPATTPGYRITGTPSFSVVDPDGDGIAGALRATVEVEILEEGTYYLPVVLAKNGRRVAINPFLSDTRLDPRVEISGPPGTQVVEIDFSGEQIYGSGIDGPYTLVMWPPGVDPLTFETLAYDHDDFGEIPMRLGSAVAERAVDVDGDGAYDVLEVEVAATSRWAGEAKLESALRVGRQWVASAGPIVTFGAGTPTFTVRFPGRDIRARGVDGPYEIEVRNVLDEAVGTTRPYSASAFETPYVLPAGGGTDEGVDTDGNGLYDVLRVTLPILADSAGTYHVSASLYDEDAVRSAPVVPDSPASRAAILFGEVPATHVANGDTLVALTAGAQTLTLEFEGADVRRFGSGGPLVLRALRVESVDRTLELDRDVPVGYETAQYALEAFEPERRRSGSR